jgi:hypothetical protein
MGRSLNIRIRDESFERLRPLADAERRGLRDHAAVLLERAIAAEDRKRAARAGRGEPSRGSR